MQVLNLLLVFGYLTHFTSIVASDLPGMQSIFSFFGGTEFFKKSKPKDPSSMTIEELGVSQGQCHYDVIKHVSHNDRQQSEPDDKHILHLLSKHHDESNRKPPIMVKCLQPEPTDNSTVGRRNSLLIMESVQDIVALLKPVGNTTKRHEPGSCVLVFFYTESSLGCAQIAPYANVLPQLFPSLRIAAIDAFRFSSFNTEYGIIGLPTLLLFHQGRPIVKFHGDVGTFAEFVTRHTGIEALEAPPKENEVVDGPLPLKPIEKPDYVLGLAWIFVLSSIAYYFSRSRLYMQIVEAIKRNWRESEARLETN